MFGKKKEMTPAEKKAKLSALGEANKMATGMMKDGLSGLKKVTVASDSKEGLEKGLEKAKDIVDEEDSNPFGKSKKDDNSNPFGNSSDEESDEPEYEDDLMAECDTEEEIDDMIAKLMDKKKQLQS